MNLCKRCKTPIQTRYKVCLTCNELRNEAFKRTSNYRDIMTVFVLEENETPQQFHARMDALIEKYAQARMSDTEKRTQFEKRYAPCEQCGTTLKRHERYCDYYIPPRKKKVK